MNTTKKKHAPLTPEAQNRARLVQAHVSATLAAANEGKVAIPTATKARVIVLQAQTYLNQRLQGVRTVDRHVKQHIQAAKDVILSAFATEGVPKPYSIIDDWAPGRVQFRLHWSQDIQNQLTREQLEAMEPADEETRVAVAETLASLK